MTIFALGFRPFFLLSALISIITMLAWLLTLTLGITWPGIADPLAWHRHEMLFGYGGAVIAGFLLTAVKNWTGKPTLSGAPLAALVAIWLIARILPLTANLPLLYAIADLLFWIGFFAGLWQALSNTVLRNKVFLVLVALLGAATALSHWHLIQPENSQLSYLGSYLGLDLILIIMLVMGGRVIPFFIQRGLLQEEQQRVVWLEKGLPVFLITMFIANAFFPYSYISAVANLALALWLVPNLWAWHHKGIWCNALLWSLYLAYAWLIVGLGMRGLAMLGILSPYLGIHALTVGGLGLLTLSMMSRVSLGHTGRPLIASKITVTALIFMLSAAVVRVFLAPYLGLMAYHLSACLWIIALALFIWVYTPILIKPRPDGRPG